MVEFLVIQQFLKFSLGACIVGGILLALVGKGGKAAKGVAETPRTSVHEFRIGVDIKPFHFHHHKHND